MGKTKETDYKETVKSTGFYGVSQFINAILGAIRSKITALFIGTEGVGILGLLQSIMDFLRSTTGLGLDTTAVRQITSSEENTNKALSDVKTLYFVTAIIGAICCSLFSKPFSIYVFGNTNFQFPIIFMSVTLIFITLTAWIVATFQGLKQIKYLSYASTLGSLFSFLALIPAYYFWGIMGIVPMFIGTNAIIFFINYYYYKKLKIISSPSSWKDAFKNNKQMLGLGIYLVVGGFIFTGSILLLKAFINHQEGIAFAGIYQAIWTITTLSWTLILKVANAYYFPQLCSISRYRKKTNNYVNEQTLFLAITIFPAILILCLFSKQLLYLLYSSEFVFQHQTLFLHLIGVYLKIIITPLALLIVAKGRGLIFVITELIFWLAFFIVVIILYPKYALLSTGIAYSIAYIVYIPVIVLIAYRLDKIFLNKKTWLILSCAIVTLCIYIISYFSTNKSSLYLMIFIIVLSIMLCIINLNKHISIKSLFRRKK